MKALLLAPMGSVHRRFNGVNIQVLKDLGYEVHLLANFEKGEGTEEQNPEYVLQCKRNGIVSHSLPFYRHEIKHNIKLIKTTRELIKTEDFDIIHAHTETGGLILRLVGKTRGRKIYSPHGMSFYKGAPLKAQLIYRPIEKWICSGMNCNIAINREEYEVLKTWNPNTVELVHGIGLDIEKFRKAIANRNQIRTRIRKELGIPEQATVVLSIGELDDNKNHITVVDALKDTGFYYLICGIGPNESVLRRQADANGMRDRLILAGYRIDIPDIIQACDIFAFPSHHEGMPVAMLEAMAGGLPIVASRIRGVVDVIEDGENGYLVECENRSAWMKCLTKCVTNADSNSQLILNASLTTENYSMQHVQNEVQQIYKL